METATIVKKYYTCMLSTSIDVNSKNRIIAIDFILPDEISLVAVLVDTVAQLAANGTGNGKAGVNVGEELRGIGLNLANSEARAGVSTGGVDAGAEGTGQAADAAADVGIAFKGNGVGERNARDY